MAVSAALSSNTSDDGIVFYKVYHVEGCKWF